MKSSTFAPLIASLLKNVMLCVDESRVIFIPTVLGLLNTMSDTIASESFLADIVECVSLGVSSSLIKASYVRELYKRSQRDSSQIQDSKLLSILIRTSIACVDDIKLSIKLLSRVTDDCNVKWVEWIRTLLYDGSTIEELVKDEQCRDMVVAHLILLNDNGRIVQDRQRRVRLLGLIDECLALFMDKIFGSKINKKRKRESGESEFSSSMSNSTFRKYY